jgi:hypothetical protein
MKGLIYKGVNMFKEKYKKLVEEKYSNRFNKYKRFNRNKFIKFKELFGSFELGKLQDFYTFAYILIENNIDIKDYIEFVTVVKDIVKDDIISAEIAQFEEQKEIEKEIEKKLPKCPKCQSYMDVTKINIPQGKRNIKGWKTYFSCSNDKCLYEKFSKDEFDQKLTFEYISKEFNDNVNKEVVIDPDINNLFGININDNIKKENK